MDLANEITNSPGPMALLVPLWDINIADHDLSSTCVDSTVSSIIRSIVSLVFQLYMKKKGIINRAPPYFGQIYMTSECTWLLLPSDN